MIGRSRTIKSARLKARRRRAFIGKVVLLCVLVGGLWGLTFWFFSLWSLTIQNIEVTGNDTISGEEIASSTRAIISGRYLFTVPKASIFFYPKKAILKSIYDIYPKVEGVVVGAKNFHTLGILIRERTAEGLWCRTAHELKKGETSCYQIDQTGFIFAPAEGTSTSPLIRFYSPLSMDVNFVGQHYASSTVFMSLLNFADNLKKMNYTVTEFRDRPDGAMEAVLVGGQRLIFTSNADFLAVLANLKTITSDPTFGGASGFAKVDYIDLRFGNKVFYKIR